jgi:hypothetical protein
MSEASATASKTTSILRLPEDVVPERSMLVYKYFADHLPSFARQDLPVLIRKRILKDTLSGLAAMHEKNIVHTGNLCRILNL